MEENAPSFALNKKTILSIVGVLVLLAATGLGVYLAQQKQLFKPKAFETTPVSGPETSLTLSGTTTVKPGSEVRVSVMVRSDVDSANLFVSRLKFPTDLLQVKEIITNQKKDCPGRPACLDNPDLKQRCLIPEPSEGWCLEKNTPDSGKYSRADKDSKSETIKEVKVAEDRIKPPVRKSPFAIKNWVENVFDNQAGTISLVGGVPAPGYQSSVGEVSGRMAEIIFLAKDKEGIATVSFGSDSAIYRNSDNVNILTTKRDLTININAVTPTPVPGTSYYLENSPSKNVFIASPTDPGTGYAISTILLNQYGKVVVDQSDMEYRWSIDPSASIQIAKIEPFAACTNGIQEPCPEDHLTITVPTLGPVSATNIRVSVIQKSTQQIIAKTEFYLNLVPKNSYVYFKQVTPEGGEVFNVGQKVAISWEKVGNVLDYYNIYYIYSIEGRLESGYIGNAKPDSNTFEWIVPAALVGQKARVVIEPRSNSSVVGEGISDTYFMVAKGTTPPPPCSHPAPPEGCYYEGPDVFPECNAKLVCPTPGDINKDSKITLVDMSALLSKWGVKDSEAGEADINKDGVVNTVDYSMMINILIKEGVIKGLADLPPSLQRPGR